MTVNTSSLASTSFDDEDDLSWLFEYLTNEIDWDALSYNDEYLKARAYVAESFMTPESLVYVPKNTEAGRLYNKLRLLAKEERYKDREYQIAVLHMEKYPNHDLTKGRALAALEYAKAVNADRAQYTVDIRGGYITTNCPTKTAAAAEQLKRGRKYGVRYKKAAGGGVTYNVSK